MSCARARLFLLVPCALAILLLAACDATRTQHRRVLLNDADPEVVRPSPPLGDRAPLRIAVASVISPKETLINYSTLLDYLGKRLDRPVELIQRRTYAEINELVRAGSIDVAFVCTLAYIEGERDFGMELLVAPEVRGETVYYSYIIVPQGSDARGLPDLAGRTFAFSDPLSNSGRLAPAYALSQMGETPDSFFARYVFTYSHDNSIKAVAEKMVDGAAVDSLVYDFTIARAPELIDKTRIIDRLGPFGIPPVVVHPGIDASLKGQVRGLLTSMHDDPEGQKILRDLMIDRFVVPEPSLYDSVREVSRKVRWAGADR